MSSLRFVSRDGKMILQQEVEKLWDSGICDSHSPPLRKVLAWQDVPVHEEFKEFEYVVRTIKCYGTKKSDVHSFSVAILGSEFGADREFRLIDERLVNKLVEALELVRSTSNEPGTFNEAARALAHYQKHTVKK